MIHRITEVKRHPTLVSNGPMSITLEDGKKIEFRQNHLNGMVVIAGDWLEEVPLDGRHPEGFRAFMHYKIVSDRGPLRLSDGNPLPMGYPGDPVPAAGDYFVRKTEGYRLIQRYRFEAENASALEALRAREEVKA